MTDGTQLLRELELLATLTPEQVRAATSAASPVLAGLVEHCLDEDLELREDAELAARRGDDEGARHLEQEASAWRATARVLRAVNRDRSGAARRTA